MIIETKRLILRPLTIADAEAAYYGWTGDAVVAEYVSWLPHEHNGDLSVLYNYVLKHNGVGSFRVICFLALTARNN